MTVFIDVTGLADTVFGDLYTISGQDGGLGEINVPGDNTVFQVTYTETPGGSATADRLNTLVNTDFGTPIVITALNGGTNPLTGDDLTLVGGETLVDSSSGFPIIRIVYDGSQCLGSGFVVFDTAGNQITFPGPVLLYHELSHAYHFAINQLPFPQTACPGNTTDEPAAEIDENVMRSQLGLCLRDVCNHGGHCGSGDDCGGSSGSLNGCFIVSATTGSSESVEVNRLRRLRDRVSAASGLGSQLIDVIYREYYQFSPAIAARVQQDPIARGAILQIVVRPLLAWYTLAGTLAFDQADETAVRQAMQAVSSACPRYLSGLVVMMLEAVRSGQPLPAAAPQLLRSFAPKIQAAAQYRFASWAILDPLVQVWASAAHNRDIVEEVSQWLATAPLEVLASPGDLQLLDREFGVLAGFLGFKPIARLQLGKRLAAAWPEAASALEHHGFVNNEVHDEQE